MANIVTSFQKKVKQDTGMQCVCVCGGGGAFVVLTTTQKHFSNAPSDLLHFLLQAPHQAIAVLLVSIKSL